MTLGLFSFFVGLVRHWLWSRAAKRDPQGARWRYAAVLSRGNRALVAANHNTGDWDRIYHQLERSGLSLVHIMILMDRRLRTLQRRQLNKGDTQ